MSDIYASGLVSLGRLTGTVVKNLRRESSNDRHEYPQVNSMICQQLQGVGDRNAVRPKPTTPESVGVKESTIHSPEVNTVCTRFSDFQKILLRSVEEICKI